MTQGLELEDERMDGWGCTNWDIIRHFRVGAGVVEMVDYGKRRHKRMIVIRE